MGRYPRSAPAVLALCALLLCPKPAWCGGVITLAQAINRALAVAPSLLSADADSELNAGKLDEARAALYPNLSTIGEYNQALGYDQRISNRGLTLGQLTADYTVYDGGRRQAQVRAARYAAQAAQFGIQAAQAQIVFDATVAYFDLLHADAVVTEHAKRLKRLNTYAAIVDALERSGSAIANDVLRVRT